jgi:hypothetical protein
MVAFTDIAQSRRSADQAPDVERPGEERAKMDAETFVVDRRR